MDADDLCIKDRLLKQVEFLEGNKSYDMVGSWAILYDENRIKGIRKTEENPDIYSMKWGSPFIHPSIMMRKEAYDQLGGILFLRGQKKGKIQTFGLGFIMLARKHIISKSR